MTQSATVARARSRFDYLPVGLFGSVMGLTGLSVAWRLALLRVGGPDWLALIPSGIEWLAMASFIVITAGYAVKTFTAFHAVRAEFRHPVAGNFFGTPVISLLLLPIVVAPYSLATARLLWVVGTVGMIVFAWFVVSRWIRSPQQAAHATPAWIIPVVGLLDVPLALPVLELPAMQGLSVFALAVGLFFALPVFTLIFSRLLFEPPMPDALKPSLLFLVAPFAVGCSTYVIAAGTFDLFAEALSLLTLFMLAVLLGQLRTLLWCCPFHLAWWAVSFPLAASAIALLRFAAAAPGIVSSAIALALLALATLVIAGLFGRTVVGLLTGELRSLST